MTEADRVHSTPPLNSSSSDLQFKTLAEAEAFLQSQGFRLVPDSCDWTNDAGDDAGCYSIEDGHYGEVKGFRVEINRRSPKPTEGLSRRLMLAGLAVLPVVHIPTTAAAAEVGIPTSTPDPIYAAIERHKKAADVWDAAVEVWANFVDRPTPMPIERRIERERINDAWAAARDALDDAGVDLINTSPTTLHGIARALNYIRQHMVQEDGVYMPSGLGLKDDDFPEVIGWVDAFLGTIENAATALIGREG